MYSDQSDEGWTLGVLSRPLYNNQGRNLIAYCLCIVLIIEISEYKRVNGHGSTLIGATIHSKFG
jgi:hypothetical protein